LKTVLRTNMGIRIDQFDPGSDDAYTAHIVCSKIERKQVIFEALIPSVEVQHRPNQGGLLMIASRPCATRAAPEVLRCSAFIRPGEDTWTDCIAIEAVHPVFRAQIISQSGGKLMLYFPGDHWATVQITLAKARFFGTQVSVEVHISDITLGVSFPTEVCEPMSRLAEAAHRIIAAPSLIASGVPLGGSRQIDEPAVATEGS